MGKINIIDMNILTYKYLYHILNNNQKYIEEYCQKGQSQRSMHISRLMSVKIKLPSIDIQQKVLEKINYNESKINDYYNKINELNNDNNIMINNTFAKSTII